jgi:hypothetical protein
MTKKPVFQTVISKTRREGKPEMERTVAKTIEPKG